MSGIMFLKTKMKITAAGVKLLFHNHEKQKYI